MESSEDSPLDLSEVPTPRFHLSFRITHKSIHESLLQDYYILNVKNYLKEKGYILLCMTGGLHLDASHPHIHLHFLVSLSEEYTENKTPHTSMWKYYWSSKKAIPIEQPCLKGNFPCLHSYLYKSRINISIKSTKFDKICDTTPLESCPKRFLAYPLKEGHLIASSNLSENDLVFLTAQGKGEYASAKIKSVKLKQKKQKSLGEYQQIVNYLNDQSPCDLRTACNLALDHIRATRTEYKDHINPRSVINICQKYCYHNNLWTNDQIMEKFGV